MKGTYQSAMGKHKVSMLLLCVFFSLLEFKVEARKSSPLEREIEAKLKLLNKPAVKSIKSEDGDIIDCINIYKQPALDHPALKNHRIQMVPGFLLESENSSTVGVFNASSDVFQTWQKSGSCPEETIPIRRIRKEDLLRAAGSLDRFGRKPPEIFDNSTSTMSGIVEVTNRSDAYLVAVGYNFLGGQANINVWNPRVEKPEDFTTAQLWLKAANGDNNFESIEAGWMVNPTLYGDQRTRIFIHWTIDTYRSTGCFDLLCSGFVQTNKNIVLGGTIEPISSPGCRQYELNYAIYSDYHGKWWLKLQNNIPIGYWPVEIVRNLEHSASLVQWGGQVFSYEVKTDPPHTGTQMGSGRAAGGRFGQASYMSAVRIIDNSLKLKYPPIVGVHASEPDCYNTLNDVQFGKDPVFYFGGAGRSPPYCP